MIPANDLNHKVQSIYVELDRQYEIPLKIPMLVMGLFTSLMVFFWIRGGAWEPAVVCSSFFLAWWLLNVYPNRRYRIGWDNQRIYMREGGFKRSDYFSIGFSEIKSMETGHDGNAASKARFYPFDYIELKSQVPGQKPVVVHPPSLKDGQVKSMLLYMYQRRPKFFLRKLLTTYTRRDRFRSCKIGNPLPAWIIR